MCVCVCLCSVAFFGLTGYNRLKPHIRLGYGSVTVMIPVWFGVGLVSVSGIFASCVNFSLPSRVNFVG